MPRSAVVTLLLVALAWFGLVAYIGLRTPEPSHVVSSELRPKPCEFLRQHGYRCHHVIE